nr:hypothetical protein [uncultured Rhodoferax sp.]
MSDVNLPPLPEGECSEWLQHGKRVNAFPYPARPFTSHDAPYWAARGYSKAPLFTAAQMTEFRRDSRKAERAEIIKELEGMKCNSATARSAIKLCIETIKEMA